MGNDGISGNLLFARSVHNSLLTPGNTIDANEYDPAFALADEINEKYDAFVLPFANAFRPEFELYLQQYTALIRQLKIPCVVVGIGVQADLDLAQIRGSSIDPSVRDFVAAVLDRSASIGVRGEITQTYLNRLGFRSTDVIGCPSMFLHGLPLHIEKTDAVLCETDFVAVNRSPGSQKSFDVFIYNQLARYPHSVLIEQERLNAARWAGILAGSGAGGAGLPGGISNPSSRRVERFTDVEAWIAFMKGVVFSIGTRIHGNIAALLAGTPALVVVFDSRTLELCQYHGIPYVLIDTILPEATLAELYLMAEFETTNSMSSQGFQRYVAFLESNGLAHSFKDQSANHTHEIPEDKSLREPRVNISGPGALKSEHKTDFARWSDSDNLKDASRYCSTLAAKYIPAGATVLGVGCGKMAFEEMLPERCRYIPVDLVARDSRTIFCDLNNDDYPCVKGVTHIVVLGVLEHLCDTASFFAWLGRAECQTLILSYVTLNERMLPSKRRAVGWINDLDREELVGLASSSEFVLVTEEWINQNGRIFVFEKQIRA